MSHTGLVNEETQPAPTPSPPRPVTVIAVAGLVLALVGVALMVLAASRLRDYNDGGIVSTIIGAVLVIASLYPLWPSIQSFTASRQRGALLKDDQLVLAPGTHAVPALPSSITLDARRPSTVAAVAKALELGWSRAVAFVVPGGCTWPLPLYEFALLIADRVGERYGVALHVVTPEPTPLAVFGAEASAALLLELEDQGIIFHGGVTTRLVDWHALEVGAPMPLRVDHIIALPTMHGPGLAGVPADPDGFIPVDRWCRVMGLDGVWAAGDGTDQPVKQGGIACQQADTIAAQIAAGPGAGDPAEPPDLVLRARLLTGSSDLYLQRTVGADDSEASFEPLWSPPAKVVGRHLVPYLERKGISDRGTTALPCETRP